MTRFRSIGLNLGFSIVLFFPSLFAGNLLLDDFSDGDNANNLEQYWYYYDDNRLTGPDDRPLASPGSRQSDITVPYSLMYREAAGNKADTFRIRNYSFCVKEQSGNKYGAMPFLLGEKWKVSWGYAYPYVGMVTMLAVDGRSIDLTGATRVSFKMRSHANQLTVGFQFRTLDIARDSSFAYFGRVIAVDTAWAQFHIAIPQDLMQPGWTAAAQAKFALDVNHATELAWEVHGENNPMIASDTVDIDDIVIEGDFSSPPPNPPPTRPATAAFCAFETVPRNITPLGTYWYAFDDHDYQGNSNITRGAHKDTSTGLYTLVWITGSGFGNCGYGPAIDLLLGKALRKAAAAGDTITLPGFAGTGFNTYDSALAIYFNAKTGKIGPNGSAVMANDKNSIYFEYVADGDFKFLTLEIRDIYDVPDKNNPDRKDSRGPGNVWHYDLPKSLAWRSVEIPFDSLVIDSTRKDYVPIPFDKTKLAKVLFKAHGAQGNEGIIQIDNVYFPGIRCFGCTPAKRAPVHAVRESAFRAAYRDGCIRIDLNPACDIISGVIELIDLNGRVIKTGRISGSPDYILKISENCAGKGLYFVRVSGWGRDGKTISRQAPVYMAH